MDHAEQDKQASRAVPVYAAMPIQVQLKEIANAVAHMEPALQAAFLNEVGTIFQDWPRAGVPQCAAIARHFGPHDAGFRFLVRLHAECFK